MVSGASLTMFSWTVQGGRRQLLWGGFLVRWVLHCLPQMHNFTQLHKHPKAAACTIVFPLQLFKQCDCSDNCLAVYALQSCTPQQGLSDHIPYAGAGRQHSGSGSGEAPAFLKGTRCNLLTRPEEHSTTSSSAARSCMIQSTVMRPPARCDPSTNRNSFHVLSQRGVVPIPACAMLDSVLCIQDTAQCKKAYG